jgi:DNA-binding NarL/FixJ family response regulator
MKPSVVIVDDHEIFRSGVRAELEGLVEVLGDAGSVEEAVRLISERRPDVVLLDVHMPGGGGVEVIRQVAETNPSQRFLAARGLRPRRVRGPDHRGGGRP